ncbi:MAG: hypothetical protein QM796_15390 [Chthoniobacteraceae bacterium]
MKSLSSPVLRVGLGILALSAPSQLHADMLAKPSRPPASLPAEKSSDLPIAAPPSATLQPFIDSHLSKILTPLGTPAFDQSEIIASLKANYADGQASAPVARQAAYHQAQIVCDALIAAIEERQRNSAGAGGSMAARSSEAAQGWGGIQATKRARDRDTFFTQSEQDTWLQRAATLRANIVQLDLQERAAERAAGAWPAPSPLPAAVAKAEAPLGSDIVVGDWLAEGHALIKLLPDNSIGGGRSGRWNFIGTHTDGSREYVLHWNLPKNWTDRLVLTADGNTLDGKTRGNKHIVYQRQ